MKPLVQKAAEPDNLSVRGKKTYARLIADLIANGGQALVQPKFDGVYAQFLNNGKEWAAFSRTGERFKSISRDMLEQFDAKALPHIAYVGELWVPGEQHSVINGRSRKHSEQFLNLRLFDAFDYKIVAADEDTTPYHERAEYFFRTNLIEPTLNLPLGGKIFSEGDLYDTAQELTQRGSSAYDGLMLKDRDGMYVPGHGKDGQSIKIKPRKSGDFRVVGTTAGIGNRMGGIGALVLDLGGGVTCEVGSGLSMADVFDRGDRYFHGKIVEVEYLSVTKEGRLREPAFKRVRLDKEVADILEGNTGEQDD